MRDRSSEHEWVTKQLQHFLKFNGEILQIIKYDTNMKESQVQSTTSFDQQFTVITVQEILVICTCSFKHSHQNSFITSVSLKEKYIKVIIPFIL